MVALEAAQLFTLAAILVCVLISSVIERRIGIAPLLGSVLIGIFFGSSGFNIIPFGLIPEWLSFFALLGGMLILFLVGMETNISDLIKTSKKSLAITALGVFLPAVLLLIMNSFFMFTKSQLLLFMAATIVTATPTSLAIILTMKKTHVRAAQYLHASTIMDNLLGIFFVFILLAVNETGASAVEPLEILKIVLILLFLLVISYSTMPKIARWIFEKFGHPSAQSRLTIAFAFVLFFGAITSNFLFEAALGAFLAGVMLSEIRKTYKKELTHTIRSVGESLFFPIFFLTIGLAVSIWSVILSELLLLFVVAYTITSIAGKYLGGFFGALISKLSAPEARAIGAGLIPRGGIGLIIAHVGLALGRFTEAQFSAVVLMIVITTLVGVFFIYRTFGKLK